MDERTIRPRRTPGAGSLYEVKTGPKAGQWRGAYVVTDPLTRRRIRRYVSGHTRAEASRRLRAAMEDTAEQVSAAASPTVAWWATRWLDTIAHSDRRPATLRSYRRIVQRDIIPALGSWPLADLRPGDVDRWVGGMRERGLRPSTIALCRRVLAVCLADAERDSFAPRNVARLSRAPDVEGTTRRRALTVAEARSLLAVARDDADAGLLVTLALGTGARVGELLALDWSNVDLDAGIVSIAGSRSRHGVGPTKSHRGRRLVTLPPFALAALRTQPRRTGPVIVTPDGQPMYPDKANKVWRALRARSGFDGLRFHDLRGTYATLALARGMSPKALADVLGHDPAVLMRTYAGPIENGRDAIAAAIGEALA
jgi:integrase